MKKVIIAALAAALCASVSMGALQVYDSFSDPVQTNSADPSSVPSTWSTAAVIPNIAKPYENHSQITEGSLSYPGFQASAGNSWTTHQGSDDFTKDITGITGLNPGDTVYYSFLLKVNPSDAAIYYMRLYNTASASSSGLPFSFGLNTNDLTQIGFSVGSRIGKYSDAASATLAKTAYSYNSSDTFLIVAGYSRGTNSATSSMNLWVNPDPASFTTGIAPTPTLSVVGYSSGYTTQERTWNRLECPFNGSGSGTVSGQTIDELRVGRTWADMISTTTAAPEPPVAAFTVTPTNGLGVVSLTSFSFNDTSTGSVTNRYWDFGDGATTNLAVASVQHMYSSAGTYSVAMTVSGLAGSNSLTKTDLITVSNPVAPTASFTASKVTGYAPLAVTFTDTSAGTITNRIWDFGDSYTTNITGATVAHTYASAGTYTVAMTANGPAGSDTSTRTNLITVQTLPEGTFIIDSDKADNNIGLTVSNAPPTVVGFAGQTTLTAGDDVYASHKGEQCAILVFKLPDLAGKTITDANLAIDVSIGYPQALSYPAGLDLYGVRHATSSLVTTNDYAPINSPSGTLIQDNLYQAESNVTHPYVIKETDASGDATLISWIAAQYADGAVAGDYVFLRLATDTYVFNPFTITSGDSTSSSNQVPKLTIITVSAAPVITSALNVTGTVGQAFSYQIQANNSPASFDATGLPQGLSINTNSGAITGTPVAAGSNDVTISASNMIGTDSQTLVLIIKQAAPVITSVLSATGTVDQAFSYQITADNTPDSFDAAGLPAGLSINTNNGAITGTPSAAGSNDVAISASNAGGTDSKTLVVVISPAEVVTDIDGDGLPNDWETLHFGGATNANPGAICANGINTVLEAYVAGLNPNDPQSLFRAGGTPPQVLAWNSLAGRIYSVYWTTNLMNGFQCIASNLPWTQNSLTNPAPAASSFYKIDVQLE